MRPSALRAMGSPEPCRRLEAVLGALYDLGDEPSVRGATGDGEAGEAEEESREAQPTAPSDAGGAEGERRSARGFFGGLREEMRRTAPPPSAAAPPPAQVEVVVFRARKRKARPGPAPAAPGGGTQTTTIVEKKNVNKQEFNFEKARLEVHRFGITGYEKQEQRIWERERAIMLGAKPPKKEHINYKKYQEKMKAKKTTEDEDKGQVHKGDSLKKKKKKVLKERKTKRKRSVPSIWPAGQVGKFRDGTLILQSSDIKKIKSTKVIK
ncbi:40S small subunit processome assembly factor 1 [Excalfactoria chinensis]|uniref:40S small subunit processome assembly factor 1 n=1 Tax=Excalfactoria chinensis TaxID=46218 RepID=UPI003B3BEA4B